MLLGLTYLFCPVLVHNCLRCFFHFWFIIVCVASFTFIAILKSQLRKHKANYKMFSDSIVPQLSKCLKSEAVWGLLTDQMI